MGDLITGLGYVQNAVKITKKSETLIRYGFNL